MEFLVEFEVTVPAGTAASEVQRRESAEAQAAAELSRQGHLVRLWRTPVAAVGVYRADDRAQLDAFLAALPLGDWLRTTVTPLEPHPNDISRSDLFRLPDPRLTPVFRLDATIGEPQELGDIGQGRRRIAPLTGGTFAGPGLSGTLVPGVSGDWQTVLADGTASGDIRYTLRTQDGALIAVRSQSVRYGPAEVLARLGRGEPVDPSEYIFRAATSIQTAAPELDWLNRGVFVAVAAREATGVVYETYLVS